MQDLGIIVKEFYSSRDKGDIFGVKRTFQKIILARNELAEVNFGERNYIESQVHKIYKIPEIDFQEYGNKKNAVSRKIFPGLDNLDEAPHFLNKISDVNLDKDQIIKLMVEDEELVCVLKNTEVRESVGKALFKHLPDQNSYKVEIPRDVSKNQRTAMLIHEMSHVLKHFLADNKITSPYLSEKMAIELELRTTKKISSEFYLANLREYLMCFVRTDFQLGMFANSKQDPDSVYRECLRKYLGDPVFSFIGHWQFEEKIVEKPLFDLPYAVAICNLMN